MEVKQTNLPGVLLIEPKIFVDNRGYFFEIYQAIRYQPFLTVVQSNLSRSHRNVLRGMHYQLEQAQDKLVTVIRGEVMDVVIDVRQGSPTFGQWQAFNLSDQNHHQLFIPKGYAHGFLALSEEVDFLYECSDYYQPASEYGICWADPDINIAWPVTNPILSVKDEKHPFLKDVDPQLLPVYKA